MDTLLENCQLRSNLIISLLNKSLVPYSKKVEIEFYNPQIIKSGIDNFPNKKFYLDTSCVNGTNIISVESTITYSSRPSRANMQPISDSIWFAKMKESDKVLIVTEKDCDLIEKYIFSTGFLGVTATEKLPLSLLVAIVCSPNFKIQRDLHSVGTTMAGINNDTFYRIEVPCLNEQETHVFDLKFSPFIRER